MPARARSQAPALDACELGHRVEQHDRRGIVSLAAVPCVRTLPGALLRRCLGFERLAILATARNARELAAALVAFQPVFKEVGSDPGAEAKGASAHSGSAAR